MKGQETEGFYLEFEYNGQHYVAHVKYSFPLSENEFKCYKKEAGEFQVYLFDLRTYRTFRIYLDENHDWKSDAPSLLIEPKLVVIIGSLIDRRLPV